MHEDHFYQSTALNKSQKCTKTPFTRTWCKINHRNARRPLLPERNIINEGNARRPLLPERSISKMHEDPFYQSTL